MLKCDETVPLLAITSLNAFFGIVAFYLVSAFIANASVIGSSQASTLMVLSGVILAGALSWAAGLRFSVASWFACVTANLGPLRECQELFDSLIAALFALVIIMGTTIAAILIGAIPAGIPWWGLAIITSVSVLLAACAITLTAIDVQYARLRDCVGRAAAARGRKTVPLTTAPAVLTCPLNVATCADADLQLANPSDGGFYSTSRSFVVLLAPPPTGTIVTVTADVTDGFSPANKASVDTRDILAPNTHNVGDKSRWAVRLDWTKLAAAGIRAEPANRDWTVNIHAALNNGTVNHSAFKMRVST